jgi:aspartate aminotransferase
VYAAAHEALEHDSGQYLPGRGIDALVDAYRRRLEENGFEGYRKENIATGIGAKHVLFSLLYALVAEGDEVLIPTPFWTSYRDIVELIGAEAVLLRCPPEQSYKLSPRQLRRAITARSRVLLFNNPSNPTGMVYTEDELRSLGEVLEEQDLFVISDDIYNRMIFDGAGSHHLVKTNPALRDRVIMVDSVSKTYGMPGWRVGLMAGPEAVASAVVTLNSNSITNIPGVVSEAAAAALAGSQAHAEAMCRELAAKRDLVMQVLESIPGLVCPRPQGAFYAFPDVSGFFGRRYREEKIGDEQRLCELLLDAKGVAVVPGRAFGEPRSIRISYACKPADLGEGLARLKAFLLELQ